MKVMNFKKRIFFSFLMIFSFCLFAQENELKATDSLENSAQLAMTEANYMVTAGDVYQLIFNANGNAINYTVIVDTTYKIRVANLAVLDVRGKTFSSLKKQVEEIVMKNYPFSGVQFVLTQPAVFNVVVQGEVIKTKEVRAWGLSRLSSVLENNLTDYSSTRKIQVTSSDGKTRTYDLFQATRFGKLSQNPYMRPGDVITIGRYDRKVTVNGQVERPGTYELLQGENLKTLISYYGGGLTEFADTTRVTLVRNHGGEEKAGNFSYLSKSDIDSDFALNNGDIISISSLTDLLPSVIVEGIIEVNDTNNAEEGVKLEKPTDTSYSVSVKFHKGENYATFVRRITGIYTQYSDLENSYFERNGEKIALNIRMFLDKADLKSEYNVDASDRIIIPYRQYLSKIIIDGEVKSVVEENAWPLRRLSSIIADNLTLYSSTRNVMVTSIDGSVRSYDLFKASRFGAIDQNPYILSGERITVGRMERRVNISGEVERPGTYELLEGENILSLINYYGSGFTEFADISRIEITRLIDGNNNNNNNIGRILYLSEDDLNNDYELYLYDSVTIPSLKEMKPVAFIEGAIYVSDGVALEASNRKEIRITEGMNYATFIRDNKSLFGATSDLQNAYIIRGDKNIPINLFEYLYDASFYSDEEVKPYDILMIPFRQYFVTVSGAVHNPGRYPYIPDRKYDYYVGLAGGFIRSQNVHDAVIIRNINGKRMSKNDFITPETNIEAKTNSFGFFFNQYAPIVTTILSILTSALSIVAIFTTYNR